MKNAYSISFLEFDSLSEVEVHIWLPLQRTLQQDYTFSCHLIIIAPTSIFLCKKRGFSICMTNMENFQMLTVSIFHLLLPGLEVYKSTPCLVHNIKLHNHTTLRTHLSLLHNWWFKSQLTFIVESFYYIHLKLLNDTLKLKSKICPLHNLLCNCVVLPWGPFISWWFSKFFSRFF